MKCNIFAYYLVTLYPVPNVFFFGGDMNDFMISVYAIIERQKSFNHLRNRRNEKSYRMYGADDAEHWCNGTDASHED